MLEYGADVDAKCYGTPLLHIAAKCCQQPGGRDFGIHALKGLLQANANPFAKDDNGYSIVHFLAMQDDEELWRIVTSHVDIKSIVNSTGKYDGFSPLHVSAMHDTVAIASLLLLAGAATGNRTKIGGSLPIHVAAHFKSARVLRLLAPQSIDVQDSLGQTAPSILAKDGWSFDPATLELTTSISPARTGLISSKWCVRHMTCPPSQLSSAQAPPENPFRLRVLLDNDLGVLRAHPYSQRLALDLHVQNAALTDVLKVHEWHYVARLKSVCDSLTEDPEDAEGMAHLDGDTAICKDSFNAALGAAGAVCEAVDKVMFGELRNAFCAVRPPGHHAGPRGAVKSLGSDSHGFCLFNNVSIAASYAMTQHRRVVHRVAIVDFDVHHGNVS